MGDQLILTDDTLRVLVSVLPYSQICEELARARNVNKGGHISTNDVRKIRLALVSALADPGAQLVTVSALKLADADLRQALRRVDLDALELAGQHVVSVFLFDPARDDVASLAAAHAPL
jgi:hypothetical protein